LVAFHQATGAARTIYSSKQILWGYEVGRTTVAMFDKDHQVTLINIASGKVTGSAKFPILSGATDHKLVPTDAGELCSVVMHHPEVIAGCWDAKLKPLWESRGKNFSKFSSYEFTQTGPHHFVFSMSVGTKTGDPGTSVILSLRDHTFAAMPAFATKTIEKPDGTLELMLVHRESESRSLAPPPALPGTKAIVTGGPAEFVTTPTRVLLHEFGALRGIDRATGNEVFRTPLPTCADWEHPIELRDDALVVQCAGMDNTAKKRVGYAGAFGAADGRKIYLSEL
jgi:hypothetical protein